MKGKVKERSYRKTDYEQYHFSVKETGEISGAGGCFVYGSRLSCFIRNLWLLYVYVFRLPSFI